MHRSSVHTEFPRTDKHNARVIFQPCYRLPPVAVFFELEVETSDNAIIIGNRAQRITKRCQVIGRTIYHDQHSLIGGGDVQGLAYAVKILDRRSRYVCRCRIQCRKYWLVGAAKLLSKSVLRGHKSA